MIHDKRKKASKICKTHGNSNSTIFLHCLKWCFSQAGFRFPWFREFFLISVNFKGFNHLGGILVAFMIVKHITLWNRETSRTRDFRS